MLKVDSKKFYTAMFNTLEEVGVSSVVATTVATSLIETSLRGVDSHGIGLFPHYVEECKLGRLNMQPKLIPDLKSTSTAILDAQNTFGHYAGIVAMKEAITMAHATGVGIVSVCNSTHFGAAWYFTNIAANNGMIGVALTNTEALVNAFNSKNTFFGTNPISFSAPMDDEDPYCLDMATSTIPWNKIKNYKREKKQLESGWAFDSQGMPTTDPQKAISLSCIGGYKGFGLGMVIEILCSGLASGPLSKDIAPLYDLTVADPRKISHFFMAIDISKFVNITIFKRCMANMIIRIRNLERSTNETVMVAGDKEKQTYKIRQADGIPIDSLKFNEFLNISESFKLAVI